MREPMFPLTVPEFVSYQEVGIGRKLTKAEQDVVHAWLPIINAAYQDGKAGKHITEDLCEMDELIAKHTKDCTMSKVLKSWRWWMLRAWTAGVVEALLSPSLPVLARCNLRL